MADEKPVHIPFRVKDEGSDVLSKIEHRVEHLGHSFEKTLGKVTEMGLALGGLAGAFGFEKMIEGGKESLDQISKIGKLTGTSANNVAALRDVFEQSDMEAGQLGTTITALSKKSLALEEGSKGITKEAKRWGVELDKGPVTALKSMAKAVQDHKINAAGVAKLTRTSGENLGAMMSMLEKGPEEFQEMVDRAEKLNVHLTDPRAMEQFEKFDEASKKIHQSWRRISEKVVLALGPSLERIANKLSAWIDGVDVGKFINPLVHGLELAVTHAKILGKIMLANALIERGTKGGYGVVGGAMRAAKFGAGLGGRAASLGSRIIGKGATGVLSTGASLLKADLGPIGTVIGWIVKLAGSATGIGIVAAGIAYAVGHLGEIKEKLGAVLTTAWGAISRLGGAIAHLFSEDSAVGRFFSKVGGFFTTVLGGIISGISKAIELVAEFIEWIDVGITALTERKSIATVQNERANARLAGSLKEMGKFTSGELGMKVSDLTKAMQRGDKVTAAQRKFFDEYDAAMKKQGLRGAGSGLKARYGAMPAEAAPGNAVYQDFRGSKFEIEQKFAEGYDPGRVAVAFANDIASMGEQRLIASTTPLFALR